MCCGPPTIRGGHPGVFRVTRGQPFPFSFAARIPLVLHPPVSLWLWFKLYVFATSTKFYLSCMMDLLRMSTNSFNGTLR